MPEHLKPSQPQSHSQNLRDDALRRLSRSPHPYHRQNVEIPHASERFSSYAPPTQSPLRSTHNTDDEDQYVGAYSPSYNASTNSDSGTEADDEHFLKGLPAPKIRPHKGLRGLDGSLSSSPSPLLSPAILDGDTQKEGYLTRATLPTTNLKESEARKTAEKLRHKRRVEVIRRVTEAGILASVAGLLCLSPEVRQLIWLWRRELACQSVIVVSLISIYPFRLLRHINPAQPWKRPFPITIPAAFDPASLLYPPIITMLVSLVLSTSNPIGVLPSIILAISSLPRQLLPSLGNPESSNVFHWFISCLPILVPKLQPVSKIMEASLKDFGVNYEVLVVLQPLHHAMCDTLQYLTTTSLLPAELQLLSVALIQLLLLGSSPQAVILKAVIWGTGLGILVTCTHVLRWGIALARVPKWRFRRAGNTAKPSQNWTKHTKKSSLFGALGSSLFTKDSAVSDSSDEDDPKRWTRQQSRSPTLQLKTRVTISEYDGAAENGSVSAIDQRSKDQFMNGEVSFAAHRQRRHSLPTAVNLPPKSSKRTPSGRRKRSASSSVQSFFALTQAQASLRKWLYAGYVYVCVLAIILVGVREYVQRYALHGHEPLGWALGYLFGDLPWFRMEVVKANLQRWIPLPPRSEKDNKAFCHLGWVEHLRHSSFGEANTRLILCGYWLGIIIVGLLVVFRLSAIYEVDTRRKVFHFMMVAMLLPATFVDPTFAALALSLMLAIFLLLDLFRATQLPPLSKHLAYFLTPYVDGRDLKGPVVISHIFLLIGCAIPLWLSLGSLPRTRDSAGWEVPTREVSMVSGVICVGMGDAAASLIGRRYGRRKWVWGGGKSIEGSIAFATAVTLTLVLAKAWIRVGGWQANNNDSWFVTIGKAGVAAWVASLTEAVLTGGNDNVVVPVILWLSVKGLDI
ncbi:Dolichol kinase sec59 [Lachnellula arida]|uniref:dolichol kinase n=1 Tax=Lachnellula arida TaxID=1316785 RepID=A0A8T9BQH9_9HELO|nr:Dolichol kinase sec59 [Lachnellula arida]